MSKAETRKNLGRIARKLAKRFDPEKIILFGSWAWGRPRPDSDVDLMIVKETENTRKLARAIDGYLFPRPFPIDLIVFRPSQIAKRNAAGDLFIREVLRRGKILYGE